jgi:hypothetical protein
LALLTSLSSSWSSRLKEDELAHCLRRVVVRPDLGLVLWALGLEARELA